MFNHHLHKMRRSGTLKKIEMNWLSPDKPQPPEDPNQVSEALGGDQMFFPFSIMFMGIFVSGVLFALERLRDAVGRKQGRVTNQQRWVQPRTELEGSDIEGPGFNSPPNI